MAGTAVKWFTQSDSHNDRRVGGEIFVFSATMVTLVYPRPRELSQWGDLVTHPAGAETAS